MPADSKVMNIEILSRDALELEESEKTQVLWGVV